jgi:hypothetical protein
MLALELEDFHVELTEGTISTVGAPRKAATAKLFDVTDLEARAFGNDRVKIVCADGEGNELQVALDDEQAAALAERLTTLTS